MNRRLSPATRRLVLGTALAAALALWLVPQPTPVRAQSRDVPLRLAQAADPKAAEPKASAKAAPAKPADAEAAADADEAKDAARDGAEVTIGRRGVVVEKGRKSVRVDAFGHDREYDSFESFVQDAPWLAGLVFMTVLLVFLVPLLIIVLLIWYKVRKNRMLNETMITLAEKGVPPADAMAALDVAQGARAPANPPLYEQAKALRQRAVASDLRKGVILIAIGLALSFFSMFDDGSPNSVGLVLLFLGIGYFVLWFLEGRTPAPRAGGVPPPGGA